MNDKISKPDPVIHVKVNVSTSVNPKTGELEYLPKYKPETIPVTEPDTTIIFKLNKAPDGVRITAVNAPEGNTQLSPPSISKNGKTVIINDINTEAEIMHLQFVFGKDSLSTERHATCDTNSEDQYPEIVNEPPLH